MVKNMKLYDVGSWTKSSFSANSFSDNQINQRADSRTQGFGIDTAAGGVSTHYSTVYGQNGGSSMVSWTSGYDVVGINAPKIPQVRHAIEEYVKKIEDYLDGINSTTKSIDNAFKSEEVRAAMENYIKKVKTYCINLVSQLNAFSDKLADVLDAYNKNMAKLSSTIDSGTSSFSAGEHYKTQFGEQQ